jgi:hypothetical protein
MKKHHRMSAGGWVMTFPKAGCFRVNAPVAKARIGAGLLGLAMLVMATPSHAAIKCDGPFQIIKGYGKHATSYCENKYLAAIARSYGWKVSDQAVRHNPGLQGRICRQIGHDSRLIGICSNHREGGRNHWPF